MRKQLAEHCSQHFVCDLATLLQRMLAIHDDLRFDNRNETCLLTQRRITSQCMGIGFNAAPTRKPIADRNHRAPLGKARAHANVFSKSVAQSIQAFCDLFTRMPGQLLGACIHFDAGNDTRLNEDFDKGRTIFLLLPDGFVVEDCAAYRLTQPWSGHNQFAISSSSFDSLRNSKLCEALVTGSVALIHREQALVIGEKQLCGVSQHLRIHLGLLS